ncbi:MAG: hypothetical protein L3J25_11685 [Flavobacteriaceae bacterium]|nr:hypothetical protein [Flavobacteriaceae bacterium]
MKKNCLIIVILICLTLSSCYKDDDFVDITQYDVFLLEVTLFYNTTSVNRSYDYDLVYHHTNGFNQIISYGAGFRGPVSDNQNTRFRAVHEYKKVGVTIRPIENVVSYKIKMKELGGFFPDNTSIINIENPITEEVTIMYNFDTDELEIN